MFFYGHPSTNQILPKLLRNKENRIFANRSPIALLRNVCNEVAQRGDFKDDVLKSDTEFCTIEVVGIRTTTSSASANSLVLPSLRILLLHAKGSISYSSGRRNQAASQV